MASRKKNSAAKASESNAPASDAPASSNDTAAVEEVAAKAGVPTYRTDLGESLPPQKYPGVE